MIITQYVLRIVIESITMLLWGAFVLYENRRIMRIFKRDIIERVRAVVQAPLRECAKTSAIVKKKKPKKKAAKKKKKKVSDKAVILKGVKWKAVTLKRGKNDR